MKKNKISTAYMIPLLRNTFLHDLYHIRPLLHNHMIEKSKVKSLIDMKDAILNLLPVENDALKESVTIPPKSLGDIYYYDQVNKQSTTQYELLYMIEKCESARHQLIKETLEVGIQPELKELMKKIYNVHRRYLSRLNSDLVRP